MEQGMVRGVGSRVYCYQNRDEGYDAKLGEAVKK